MTKSKKMNHSPLCPCGTGKAYLDCCGSFITNQKIPSTPEQLMRSRYTAYSQANIDYIIQTMKSPAADGFDPEETREWTHTIHWSGLNIIKTEHNSKKGTVEFVASYYDDGKKNSLHEISEFQFENGKWYYINGIKPNKKLSIDPIAKIGRNDICPCGSNKKYKKCCGNK